MEIKELIEELLDADNCCDASDMIEAMIQAAEALESQQEQIAELESVLAEREKVVIQLRKQWQDAEMHICTMCGHFAHKRDGGVFYGNRNCGEIVGYPYCAGKFTPWIPVTERLPEEGERCLCHVKSFAFRGSFYQTILRYDKYGFREENIYTDDVTHWMPLPEGPKEV